MSLPSLYDFRGDVENHDREHLWYLHKALALLDICPNCGWLGVQVSSMNIARMVRRKCGNEVL